MFKCRHPQKDTPVVVKQVRLGDHDSIRQALLKREIRFYSKKGNTMSGLVPHFEGEEGDEQGLHLCLEFMSGGSIKELRRQDHIPQSLMIKYAREVASALKHLHGDRIIWNGCCADHVLLDSRGKLRLVSFGLSRKGSGDLVKELQHANLDHRLRWMAPEAIQNLQYSPQTDIWAFGCFVVEMLTGNDPHYECEDIQDVRSKLAHTADPRPVVVYPDEAVNKVIPQLLDQVFMCEPAKRPTAAVLTANLALSPTKTVLKSGRQRRSKVTSLEAA